MNGLLLWIAGLFIAVSALILTVDLVDFLIRKIGKKKDP